MIMRELACQLFAAGWGKESSKSLALIEENVNGELCRLAVAEVSEHALSHLLDEWLSQVVVSIDIPEESVLPLCWGAPSHTAECSNKLQQHCPFLVNPGHNSRCKLIADATFRSGSHGNCFGVH